MNEKFENFKKSLKHLKNTYNYQEPYNDVTLVGIIGIYEMCFELAWKSMKEILEYHGYMRKKIGSPREVLKCAYEAGMIEDEEVYLDALQERNNAIHIYDEKAAIKLTRKIKEKYFPVLKKLESEIIEKWL